MNDGWRLKRRLKCLPFIFTHSSRQWQVHNSACNARTKRSRSEIVFDTFYVYLRNSSLTRWVVDDRYMFFVSRMGRDTVQLTHSSSLVFLSRRVLSSVYFCFFLFLSVIFVYSVPHSICIKLPRTHRPRRRRLFRQTKKTKIISTFCTGLQSIANIKTSERQKIIGFN